jgi:hypothetical protein
MREEEVDVAVFGLFWFVLSTYIPTQRHVCFVYLVAIDNNMLLMMLLRCV